MNTGVKEAKSYASWIIKREIEGTLLKEDYDKVTEYLTLFEKGKRLLPQNKRDIMAYKSPADLFTTLKQFGLVESGGRSDIAKLKELVKSGDLQFTGENQDWYGFKILTKKGSCAIGKGTEWCTAKYAEDDSRNMFDHYNKQGPLYVAINKHEGQKPERIQINLETDSFMDENDSPIVQFWDDSHVVETYTTIVTKFPTLLSVFPDLEQQIMPLVKPMLESKEAVKGFLADLNASISSFVNSTNFTPFKVHFGPLEFSKMNGHPVFIGGGLLRLIFKFPYMEQSFLSVGNLDEENREESYEIIQVIDQFLNEAVINLMKKHNVGISDHYNKINIEYTYGNTDNYWLFLFNDRTLGIVGEYNFGTISNDIQWGKPDWINWV